MWGGGGAPLSRALRDRTPHASLHSNGEFTNLTIYSFRVHSFTKRADAGTRDHVKPKYILEVVAGVNNSRAPATTTKSRTVLIMQVFSDVPM